MTGHRCQSGRGRGAEPGGFLAAWGDCDPETVLVRVGCVHEHVGDYWLCPRHAASALAGATHCGQCWHLNPPHLCPQLAEVAP